MTRLYYEIIKDVSSSLNTHDDRLQSSTGYHLLGLASRACHNTPEDLASLIKTTRCAVIPISSGEGLIPGFTEAVASILRHLGLKTDITNEPDVGGFAEAVKQGADILFAADDHRFLAMDTQRNHVIDNVPATAHGFVEALAAAAERFSNKGLMGQNVLVIGTGPVGRSAIRRLQNMGAKVFVRDKDPGTIRRCLDRFQNLNVVQNLENAFQQIDYILDATPSAHIIDETRIRPATIVSSPGVPHGLTGKAEKKIGRRFIHDNLALGVAVMALKLIASRPS